ncbi:hypothetical protein [Sutcliffiella rhizosphaerae]|uniref:Uncharacterized protein n=1 Tax=Sutcliffiella rhizosphaerae TaxID=2880967 RepID=A0ABN8A8N3_9BACI|nr:hypothetical protein [Sutcliffiella rhizosphaerae]CAG9621519.1 hypothetical protein BACCIP111883_02292 [Sutcliffiella rhizosphaerae]
MERILENRREEKEWILIFVTICSFLTCKRMKSLERFKRKLRGELYIE